MSCVDPSSQTNTSDSLGNFALQIEESKVGKVAAPLNVGTMMLRSMLYPCGKAGGAHPVSIEGSL
jgi:hypothetical protein